MWSCNLTHSDVPADEVLFLTGILTVLPAALVAVTVMV